MKNLLSCLFVCAILLLSKAVCAQIPEEIVITGTRYVTPLSFYGWAVEYNVLGAGAGQAAAGNAYGKYLEKIAKQNACLDKKNALAAAATDLGICIDQSKVYEAIYNNNCTTVTSITTTVSGGVDSTSGSVATTWNPRETCMQKNHNDKIIAEGKCNSDYNTKVNRVNAQYKTLPCS